MAPRSIQSLRVTLTGTGTSTGVPSIGCTCPVCASPDPRDKRLRAGVLLEFLAPGQERTRETRRIVLDCGADFREQALRHSIDRLEGVIVTHSHFDHIGGLDDLRIYNFRQGQSLPVYGPTWALDDIRARFPYFFDPPREGGGVASLDLHAVGPEPFEAFGLRIVPIPVKHGRGDVYGYRIGDYVHVTDASSIAPESLALMEDAEVLVLNALRPTPHSTHLSLDEAVDVARLVRARRTYFVHMNHDLGHEATNAYLPEGMALAYDGQVFWARGEGA